MSLYGQCIPRYNSFWLPSSAFKNFSHKSTNHRSGCLGLPRADARCDHAGQSCDHDLLTLHHLNTILSSPHRIFLTLASLSGTLTSPLLLLPLLSLLLLLLLLTVLLPHTIQRRQPQDSRIMSAAPNLTAAYCSCSVLLL